MDAASQTPNTAPVTQNTNDDNPVTLPISSVRPEQPQVVISDSNEAARAESRPFDQPTIHIASPHAVSVVESTLQVAHLLRGRLTEAFSEFGLNEIRFQVLNFILRKGSTGCSQRDLADELCQSESSVSTLIERMRNDSLLHRLQAQHDRRKHVLMVSDQGREVLESVRTRRASLINELLEGLTREELEQLAVLVARMADELTDTPRRAHAA